MTRKDERIAALDKYIVQLETQMEILHKMIAMMTDIIKDYEDKAKEDELTRRLTADRPNDNKGHTP